MRLAAFPASSFLAFKVRVSRKGEWGSGSQDWVETIQRDQHLEDSLVGGSWKVRVQPRKQLSQGKAGLAATHFALPP